jgi:octaprenyl-diphosphate synthase
MSNRDQETLSQFKPQFDKINRALELVLESRIPLIVDMGGHSLLGGGKRLRPLLFVLSSRLCGYAGEDLYRLSTIFECIHTASLLHDDVLDNAEVRRRKPSANQLWGNHAAVLEGDFLYSKSFSIAVSANNFRFLERLTETTTQMAEGQILELIHTDDWNMEKEAYLEVITAKTAVLISAACACGAIVAGADEATVRALGDFGMGMGIAFQLMDDVLDYSTTQNIFGKPVGKDLREGKITLPLIYAIPKLEKEDRHGLEVLFKERRANEADYRRLIGFVRKNGVLGRIRDEARVYVDEAAQCLAPFSGSPMGKNLLDLNRYIIDRSF